MSDILTANMLDAILFRQPQLMRVAIHPGRGFAFREMGCLRLSDDERNFRRISALDNL